ncbi:MAG: ABC transporter permease [Candidatus Latescibacteria bacterium]|nr:ABC transporter permease [Candidatus Latescibacterota bacterium]
MKHKVVFAVLHKELKDALRDRRTLYTTFLVPLLLPALILLPMTLTNYKEKTIQEKPSKIAILYPERFPQLARRLASSGQFLIVEVEKIEWALRRGYISCALEIENVPTESEATKVVLIFDQTKEESAAAAAKLRMAVRQFSDEIARQRIRELNLDPRILNPIVLKEQKTATGREVSGFLLGLFVAMIAVLGAITGGMTLAIDATAGEKERKTLEVLIASPATRNELVMGKFLATITMAMLSVLLTSLSLILALRFGTRMFSQLGEHITVELFLSRGNVVSLFLSLLLVASLMASIEMSISLFARSFREAQSYLTPLTIAAVLPILFMQAIPSNPPGWMFFIPLLNSMLLIRELFMGIPETVHIISTLLSSLLYVVVALRSAFRLFQRESVVLR